MARHNEIGEIGERITLNYLTRKGFDVICMNYRKKWGEIDVVAIKDNILHFVEVKTVSRSSVDGKIMDGKNDHRPEDNVHPMKARRLERAMQTYLLENYKKNDPEWQFDLACVFLDKDKKVAKIKFMENIVLELILNPAV